MLLKNNGRRHELLQLFKPLIVSAKLSIVLTIIFLGFGILPPVESYGQFKYQINATKALDGIGPLLAQLNSEHKIKLGHDEKTIADEKVEEINKLGDHFAERAKQLEIVDTLKNSSFLGRRSGQRRSSKKRYCLIRVSSG